MASLYPNLLGMAFIPYYNHIVKLFENDSALKETAKGILQQMGYAAAGAAIGGICAGPPGALFGTIIGGVVGYMRVSDYDSLIKVLRDMNDEEKKELVGKVQQLVGSSSLEALTEFIGSQVKRELFVNLVNSFVNNKK